MATFILIPGAGGEAWYWHRVVAELVGRGHRAVGCDLPAGDDASDIDTYATAVVERYRTLDAAGSSGHPLVVVGQSLGGFTVPVVAERLSADAAVLLNAMIPRPGETPGVWFAESGSDEARRAMAEREGRDVGAGLDAEQDFLHDLPSDVLAEALRRGEPNQSGAILDCAARFDGWPTVTVAVAGRDDRFFPHEFQMRQARERLGADPVTIPGGHLAALSQPVAVADALTGVVATR